LVDNLVVGDGDIGDIAGHLGRQRGDVAGGVGVVGRFVSNGAGPAVPVAGDVPGEDAGADDAKNAQGGWQPAEAGS
jgi:hypothetical protein